MRGETKNLTSSCTDLEEPVHLRILKQVNLSASHFKCAVPKEPWKAHIVHGVKTILLQGDFTKCLEDVRE